MNGMLEQPTLFECEFLLTKPDVVKYHRWQLFRKLHPAPLFVTCLLFYPTIVFLLTKFIDILMKQSSTFIDFFFKHWWLNIPLVIFFASIVPIQWWVGPLSVWKDYQKSHGVNYKYTFFENCAAITIAQPGGNDRYFHDYAAWLLACESEGGFYLKNGAFSTFAHIIPKSALTEEQIVWLRGFLQYKLGKNSK
ncbi:MAG: hypothetical protein LBT21_05845 [Oscillospiraceae bacterium]|jgi:hypothetical protein|nr:hypothetical protein [Oscillospiraceae bacterium]